MSSEKIGAYAQVATFGIAVGLNLDEGITVSVFSQGSAGIEIARGDRFFRKIGMRQLGGNYGVKMEGGE
ncbi:MAG: hypothetical protein AAGI36_13880 [Pseudomonadota bacterium]